MPSETKQDVLNEIAHLIGRRSRTVSRGSTEPREAFEDIVDALGLKLPGALTKPQLAGAIARAGGQTWDESCHSDNTPSGGGGTITLVGDRRVREAVRELLRRKAGPVQPSLDLPTPKSIEPEAQVAEEASDYGSDGAIEWESVQIGAREVSEDAYQRLPDAARQRDLLNAAVRGHGITLSRLQIAFQGGGAVTKQGRRSVDLLAQWPDGFQFLAEVKTIPGNPIGRIRLGLGQLFEYRYRSELPGDVALGLVLDRPLNAPDWVTNFVVADRGVNLLWWDAEFFVFGRHAKELVRRSSGVREWQAR